MLTPLGNDQIRLGAITDMSIFSKKTRYAIHGLAYVAEHSQGSAVPAEEILAYLEAYAGGLALSSGYILKILQEVSKAGLLHPVYGPGGGYVLARGAETIHLVEVVEALEGPVVSGCCLLSVGNCAMEGTCGVRDVLSEAEGAFRAFLEEQSLQSIADRMTFPKATQALAEARRGKARRV